MFMTSWISWNCLTAYNHLDAQNTWGRAESIMHALLRVQFPIPPFWSDRKWPPRTLHLLYFFFLFMVIIRNCMILAVVEVTAIFRAVLIEFWGCMHGPQLRISFLVVHELSMTFLVIYCVNWVFSGKMKTLGLKCNVWTTHHVKKFVS